MLPEGPFDLILADPPWDFGYRGCSTDDWIRRASDHYPTMDLAAIRALPVREAAAPNAVLLLWTTMAFLPAALGVVEAWGFAFKTVAFTWVKLNANGEPFMGMGYYTRQNAELCLLATKGKGLPRKAKDVPSVLLSRRREHSRKPDGAYDHIARLFGADLRRLELFARQAWPGWECWGFDAPEHALLALPLEIPA